MKRLTLTLGLLALAAVLAACSGASAAAPSPGRPGRQPQRRRRDDRRQGPEVRPDAMSRSRPTPRSTWSSTTRKAPRTTSPSPNASGASVFKGDIVSSTKVTYTVPALAAGTYSFICEVHPDMKGTITAQ